MLLRLGGGETDGGHLGVGEDDLRHAVAIGGGSVPAPGLVVQRTVGRAGDDGIGGDAGLVLALVG